MSEATKNQLAEEQAEITAAQAEITAAQETVESKKAKKEKKNNVGSGRTAPEEYGPDVVCLVPVDPLNPGLDTIPVYINEYEWIIKRGEKQIVPEAVLDVLHNAGYL